MNKATGQDVANLPEQQGGAAGLSGEALLGAVRKPGYPLVDLMQVAEGCNARGQTQLAVELYETWIGNNPSPLTHIACFNLGATLSGARNYQDARKWYEKALELAPDFMQAHLNLGTCHEQLKEPEKAIEQWKKALSSSTAGGQENKALRVHALNNLGRLLETLKRYDEALEMLEKSLSLDKSQKDVILHLIHLRQRQCLWPIYKPLPNVGKQYLKDWTSPLAILAESDDPARQLSAATTFVGHKYADRIEPLSGVGGYGHEKLRIGYLSSDYCLHPVSMLTVEMFELHDRSRFEVHGFCWSPEDGSGLRVRVMESMDSFTRIGHLSDEEAAKRIRDSEIDILVDLHGLTSGARPYILAHRPAPVQLTYLGFPGTTGLPWLDYVIADDYVIPHEFERSFSEKPLRMDDCFQVSDSKRPVGPTPTRAENGLPEDAFVFCAFNNNYKYTQEVFAAWMRILRKVPDSVLWLLADNRWAKDNMIDAAKKAGVKPERLIFATRVLPQDYLARYRIADLFLDTFPFNGGTTANDALWMELPILTLSGRTFASRMAGSLLRSLDLKELIVTELAAYEKLAVKLASDRDYHAGVRKRLAANIKTSRLFDIEGQVRNIEKLYLAAFGEAVPAAAAGAAVRRGRKSASPARQGKSLTGGGPTPGMADEPAIGIATVLRSRDRWVLEWLAFHMVAGFNRFYVYTFEDGDVSAEKLLKLSNDYPIKVHKIPQAENAEAVAFQHAYQSYGKAVDWLAFVGGAEYLHAPDGRPMGEALRDFEGLDASALAVYRRVYGSCGRVEEPEGLLLENFTRHSEAGAEVNRTVRSILRGGQEGVAMGNPHVFVTPGGTIDELSRKLSPDSGLGETPTFGRLRINWYATQSYEQFALAASAKGAATEASGVVQASFKALDRSECDDGTTYKFLVPLKLKLRELYDRLSRD